LNCNQFPAAQFLAADNIPEDILIDLARKWLVIARNERLEDEDGAAGFIHRFKAIDTRVRGGPGSAARMPAEPMILRRSCSILGCYVDNGAVGTPRRPGVA
jgi:hypothetical protein